MARIRESVSKGDATGVEFGAHALKGTAANLFASRSVDAALALEQLGRSGSVKGAEESLAVLESEIAKLQQALSEFEMDYAKS
jgi:HPt (histidine-containing phosphotransfer) domain-containing protein